MKRAKGIWVLLAVAGTWGAMQAGPARGDNWHVGSTSGVPPTVPGVQGPWGQPISMAMPYAAFPPNGTEAAQAMLANNIPLAMVQPQMAGTSGMMLAGASCPAGGCPGTLPLPPGASLSPMGMPMTPGMPGMQPPPGAVAAVGAITGPVASRFATQRTSVRFISPPGMKVSWYAPNPAAKNGFTTTQLEVPGRYNFAQASIYRLKLSEIPGRPNLELYPTLEVVPSNVKTNPFLAHSAVPVAFTEEDFEQVAAGNFVVKVIYLPDPQFQDLATTGTDEVVSTRLEPGVDPIAEAYHRGSILLVVRLGNIDLEAPNTPAMDAPNPYQAKAAVPAQGMGPGMSGPGIMVPYGALNSGKPLQMGPNGPMMMMGPNGPVPVMPGSMMSPGAPGISQGQPAAGPGATPPVETTSQLPASVGTPLRGPGDPPLTKLPDNLPIQPAFYADPRAAEQEMNKPKSDKADAGSSGDSKPSMFQRIFMGGK